MKVVQINITCGVGSTGKICLEISKLLTALHIENYILYTTGQSDYPLGIRYMKRWQVKLEALRSRINGKYGLNSKLATRKLLLELDRIRPDIVHLHNIHGHNVNLEMLFGYLKEHNVKVFYTFHDCWAFTGYCPYFDLVQCNRWENGCYRCPQRKKYSFFLDKSDNLYQMKKRTIDGLDITVITPSEWLEGLVKKSFYSKCEAKVIRNGIDLSVFHARNSDFRRRNNIRPDQFLLLGVAFDWGIRKGLDVFIELSKRLDPEQYQIVLVGTDDRIDKLLPSQIISIHRTENQQELAEIYTAADLFVNPTREEVFGLVNVEALACGTPVITFDTGGSPECIDESCGIVVPCDDVDALEAGIRQICENHLFSSENCLKRAKLFDQNNIFPQYIDCYLSR